MAAIDIQRSVRIQAPAETVRRQFGDVAHHADAGVHRGVRFDVLDDDGTRCRYLQVTSVGPLRFTQEVELDRVAVGPLVNHIVRGQFAGGTITFDVQPDGEGHSTVDAALRGQVHRLGALAAPLLRRSVGRALDRALAEDRDDLESGAYLQASAAIEAAGEFAPQPE